MRDTRTRTILALHAAALVLSAIAVAHAGEPADDALHQATALEAQGHLEEARFYYGKALLHRPSDRAALLRLGIVQARLGEPESARIVLGRLQRMCATCAETQQLDTALATHLANAK